MKLKSLTLLLSLFAFCACSPTTISPPKEKVTMNPTKYGYIKVRSGPLNGGFFNEYTKANDPEAITKQFISQTYVKTNKSVASFTSRIEGALGNKCPTAKIQNTKLSDTEYLLEVTDKNACGGKGPHRSFRKFIAGSEGIFIIAFNLNEDYVHKNSEYSTWRKRIINTKLRE
jgi:hypothetical protein